MNLKKMHVYELKEFDKIIIYGAGTVGLRLALEFCWRNFDKSKLIFWDKRFKEIGTISAYDVHEPQLLDFYDKNVPVIIAMHPDINKNAMNEIRKEFQRSGYNNFIEVYGFTVRLSSHKIRSEDFYAEAKNTNMYECEYQEDIDFSDFHTNIKALAYYLPQFHDIPENDIWWGKGFTEWKNTRKAQPLFKGHYQPREPHEDLGYYNLSDVETIRKQAEIAKKHGIYGWCIYYYWFSGKKLLEKPLDFLLNHKDIDINFCLCWVNETWTKSWVGRDKEVLIEQKYMEDDPALFIADLKKYTDDSRYIRVAGKPLLIIYNPDKLPKLTNVVKKWREEAVKCGIGQLHILTNCRMYTPKMLGLENSVDGAAAFAMHVPIHCSVDNTIVNKNNETEFTRVTSYKEYLDEYINFLKFDDEFRPYYRSCLLCFDNTARYFRNKTGFITMNYHFSLENFYRMAKANVEEANEMNKEFTFVFSWNEWCEGAYLEPDKKYGYAVLNTFSKALFDLPFDFGKIT